MILMHSTFFRFPPTPHLAWLGSGPIRDDKVFTPQEAKDFLAHAISVEEKVDGANIGFSPDASGEVQIQQRGDYLQAPTAASSAAWSAGSRFTATTSGSFCRIRSIAT